MYISLTKKWERFSYQALQISQTSKNVWVSKAKNDQKETIGRPFVKKLGRYSSLALLRSYGPLKTHKEVSESPGNNIEQVEDRMDLDMSQLGKRPLESMRKFESQSNAAEHVQAGYILIGLLHVWIDVCGVHESPGQEGKKRGPAAVTVHKLGTQY